MKTIKELTQAYHDSEYNDEQEDVIKELVRRGEDSVARELIRTFSFDKADEYTHCSYALQNAMIGDVDVAHAHVIKLAEETESFSYCLALAYNIYQGASVHTVDERWTALIKELFEYAIMRAANGLADPVCGDVEEEDHYYAEIANYIAQTIKDEELFHKALRQGVDLSKAFGGGAINHFFSVVPSGYEMSYFELYLDDFLDMNYSDRDLEGLLWALDFVPNPGEAKALLIERLTKHCQALDEEVPEDFLAMINAKEV